MLSKLWWKLVALGFRLLYNEMAWTYDLVAWGVSLGQWRNWQRAALKYLPGEGLILEMAHGTGNLQLDLAEAGYRRVALDFSPYMGRIAQHKLRKHHISAPFIRAKAQTLPFPDATFDAIVSTFPTPFIVELETLREAHRVLKPEGRLVIVPNAVFTSGGVAKEALETAYRVTGQRGDTDVFHVEERFHEAGFTLESFTEPCKYSLAQVLVAQRQTPSS